MPGDHGESYPPLRIASQGTVFEGAHGSEAQSAAFACICVLPSGDWLCSFRAAPKKGEDAGQKVLLTWSKDQGATWAEPIEPVLPREFEGRFGRFRYLGMTSLGGDRVVGVALWVDHTDPSLPFFNEETEGLLDSRIFLTESHDAGRTWSAPEPVDTAPFHQPTPLTGPILRLPNGEWACQFELNKPYYDRSEWWHASVMLFSPDEGKTWPRHSVVTQDPENRVFYWDQRASVLPDGRLLDVFWTYDRTAAVYLNIHARESFDNGHTWSELWDTGVRDQPAPAFPLADGTLGMVYVDREGPPMLRARRSADMGRSWMAEGEAVLHETEGPSQTWAKRSMQDAWAEMGKYSMGLPHTAPLPGGGAVVVYYAGPETDVTGIHWAVVQ